MPKTDYVIIAEVVHRVRIYVAAYSREEARDLVMRGDYVDEDIIEYVATESVESVEVNE